MASRSGTALATLAAIASATACGSPYYETRRGEEPPPESGSAKEAGGSAGEAPASSDGSAGEPSEASAVFGAAGPFVSRAGASARRPGHEFESAPTTNPAGQPCLDCHKAGGDAPAFTFAGTVFRDPARAVGAAGVEVRVGAVSAFTDADGNFFSRASQVALPSRVGIRSSSALKEMREPVEEGNCNSCHKEGSEPRLALP